MLTDSCDSRTALNSASDRRQALQQTDSRTSHKTSNRTPLANPLSVHERLCPSLQNCCTTYTVLHSYSFPRNPIVS